MTAVGATPMRSVDVVWPTLPTIGTVGLVKNALRPVPSVGAAGSSASVAVPLQSAGKLAWLTVPANWAQVERRASSDVGLMLTVNVGCAGAGVTTSVRFVVVTSAMTPAATVAPTRI